MRRLPTLRVLALRLLWSAGKLGGGRRAAHTKTSCNPLFSPSARHFADYDTAPLAMRFSVGDWDDVPAWQKKARAKLAELCGYSREASVPVVVSDEKFDLSGGLVRRRVVLRVREAVHIPVHLIEAKASSGPRPIMICLQGTNSGAHLSWGEVRYPADADKVSGGYNFAVQAARRGYLAVAVEQSCFGERAEAQISPRSVAPCVDATMHAILLGRSLLGERCYDVSRVCDWLMAEATNLSVRSDQIDIMGHSAGGSVALFAAALDQRIRAVLACGCIGYIRTTIGRRRDDQGQNVVPGILNWFELADIVALVAPRPFVTVAGENDHIWPAAGARSVVDEARQAYARLNAIDNIVCQTATGGHLFRPELSWRVFEQTIGFAGL